MSYEKEFEKDFMTSVVARIETGRLTPQAEKHPLVSAVIHEIVDARLKAAALSTRDDDETGWRRITTGQFTRDMTPIKQERMYEFAVYIWENYPLGKWIIEILKDFLVAEGMPFESGNKDIYAALEEFWYDPLNQMDVYIEKHVREQWLFGVLCLPAFTSKACGRLRLGYIDPAQIDKPVTDPGNVKMVVGVILKSQDGQPGLKLKTIFPPNSEEVLSPRGKALRDTFTDGECFYNAVNNLTNNPLGRSELLVSADGIDVYENFLFDAADKWTMLNAFIYDITVEQGNEDDLEKQKQNFEKKAGALFVHNEKVKLQAITPDLKSQDVETGAKTLRNHILGAHGYPSFWFGGGEDANRALGVEMGTPAFKMLSSKQRVFKALLENILQTVIDRRRAARTLICSDEDAKNWSIVLPELSSKDVSRYSAALQQVMGSLGQAIQQEIIDTVTARKMFVLMAGQLGMELDEADIETRVREELDAKAKRDYNVNPNPKMPQFASVGPKEKLPPEATGNA